MAGEIVGDGRLEREDVLGRDPLQLRLSGRSPLRARAVQAGARAGPMGVHVVLASVEQPARQKQQARPVSPCVIAFVRLLGS